MVVKIKICLNKKLQKFFQHKTIKNLAKYQNIQNLAMFKYFV